MFKKYTSIENTYRKEYLDKIVNHHFQNNLYVVQEKAHGANLSYYSTNGIDFQSAKRTSDIEETESFYNHDIVLENIKPKLQNIWKKLKRDIPNVNQVTIFGELIGGDYPHPNVEPNKKAVVVQKGIYYSPDNHFYAFDILINTDTFLDLDIANKYFKEENVLHAKTIFSGTLEECLNYPNQFNSLIPADLKLPELTPNTIEGVVIKPNKSLLFNNGTRVILKNKNDKWAENKRFHKSITKQEPLSEQVLKLQEAIATYVTENRLNNVISKIGQVNKGDFGRLLGLFNKDIVEDFNKDYGHLTQSLEKKETKAITKSINKLTTKMVENKLTHTV